MSDPTPANDASDGESGGRSPSPSPDELADLHTNVETWPIEDVLPYGNNPKEHPPEQVDRIASSIRHYGWDQPIVTDETGEILKGHGRLEAAKKLDLGVVPVIVRTDLSPAQKKAARIADNRASESEWDDELLSTELELIQDDDSLDVDIEESTGFDPDEIDDLADSVTIPDFEPVPEDEQPRLDERTGTETDPDDDSTVRCPDCGHTFQTGM